MNAPTNFPSTTFTTLNCRAFSDTSEISLAKALCLSPDQLPLTMEQRLKADAFLRTIGVKEGVGALDNYWRRLLAITKVGPQYIDDHVRMPLIGEVLGQIRPDFSGLTEVWGPSAAASLRQSLIGQGSHFLEMPYYLSFHEIFSVISEKNLLLAGAIFVFLDPTVQFLAQSQLNQTGETNFGRLQKIMKAGEAKLIGYFEGKTFYGPGLQPISLLDVDHWEFIPFRALAGGFEYYTKKGFVAADIRLKEGQRAHAIVTHLAVGDTARDQETRFTQLEEIFAHIATLDPSIPLIMMGDFNVREGSEEYTRLKTLMAKHGLTNAYRQLHPEINLRSQHTYNDRLHYQQRLKMACAPGSPNEFQILDYVWVSVNLQVDGATILGPELHHPSYGGKPITDHRGVTIAVSPKVRPAPKRISFPTVVPATTSLAPDAHLILIP